MVHVDVVVFHAQVHELKLFLTCIHQNTMVCVYPSQHMPCLHPNTYGKFEGANKHAIAVKYICFSKEIYSAEDKLTTLSNIFKYEAIIIWENYQNTFLYA